MSFDIKKANPKKILVINTFGIGDVLFTTPFVANLKKNFPDVSIDYVGNRRTVSVLERNPDLKKIFVYERDEFNAVYKVSKIAFLKKVKALLEDIKGERYDIVFDFSLNSTINFLTLMAGIKHRIGFNYKNRSPYLTLKIPFDGFEKKHVAQYYLDIISYLDLSIYDNNLKFIVLEEDRKWAQEFLLKAGYKPQQKLVGIIPGAGESWGNQARFRRWPVENYAKLVDKLIENFPLKFILMGASQEEELCKGLKSIGAEGFIEAYGKTTIGQFAALLQLCDLVILNDGGPLHVAVAVGTKTVSIFGPVDEIVYGPFGPAKKHLVAKRQLACQPCYRRFRMTDCEHISCLKTLSVNEVYEKVRMLL